MAAQTANTKKTGSWDLPLKIIKTGIVSWLIVFLFWGLGSLQYDEIFLPSPTETWTAIKELVSNGTLWADIAASGGVLSPPHKIVRNPAALRPKSPRPADDTSE